MGRVVKRERQRRRLIAGTALFSWLVCVHLLPLLHIIAHDFPHQHVGGAIVYLLDALEHRHTHHHHHQHGSVGHTHEQPDADTGRANTESSPPGFDEHDSEAPSSEREPTVFGAKELAHGFVSILSPVVASVRIATRWMLPLGPPPAPCVTHFVASVTQRARGPPKC